MLTDSGMETNPWERDWRSLTTAGVASADLPLIRPDVLVLVHRAEVARKVAAWREAEVATEMAMARYDERWGTQR